MCHGGFCGGGQGGGGWLAWHFTVEKNWSTSGLEHGQRAVCSRLVEAIVETTDLRKTLGMVKCVRLLAMWVLFGVSAFRTHE